MSTACTQNLAPMVTQAMRSVAKTAGRCWAIPNWRPESAASLLRILAPVTGRGDMIVLLRPYGGHGWQCAGLRVYGTVGDNTGVEADAGAATAGAVWTVLPVKTAQDAAASVTTAGAPLDGGGGGWRLCSRLYRGCGLDGHDRCGLAGARAAADRGAGSAAEARAQPGDSWLLGAKWYNWRGQVDLAPFF